MAEELNVDRTYGRNDFAALRGYVQNIVPAVLARMYYDADEDVHASTPAAMERYLRQMLDDLVQLALEHGTAPLAEHLNAAKRRHGTFAKIGPVALQMVFEAAKLAAAPPLPNQSVGMWFKPMVSRHLKSANVATLAELVEFCNRRGGSWWRAIPRIGPGRAARIVSWLRQHEDSIGITVLADVDLRDPLAADDAELITVDMLERRLAPLERIRLGAGLAGGDGLNRSQTFPLVRARDDLEAVRAYLHLYRDQPKTLRAYTKELERFVLWCVTERGCALSSALVDECEAYKDFLKAPSSRFVGPRAVRYSDRWRPFASEVLKPSSQAFAVRIIRSAFQWLVDARYLASNPWKLVADPIEVEKESLMQVERALSMSLWDRLRLHMDDRCLPPDAIRWRTVRAFMLLLGDSGIRREEAMYAVREKLRLQSISGAAQAVWSLTVIGKRRRERTVPVSEEAVQALQAHWADRNLDFSAPQAAGPLLAPPILQKGPPRPRKLREWNGYHPNNGNDLLAWAKKRFLIEMDGLDDQSRLALASLTPHALRHTFGTQSVAHDVPLDVVQRILGHRSLNTTSIYVQAEKQRILREAAAYYGRNERET